MCVIFRRTSNLPWMIKKLWHHHPRLRQNYHHHQLHHRHQTERINDPSSCYRLMEHRKINHQNQIVHQVRLVYIDYITAIHMPSFALKNFSRLAQKIAKKKYDSNLCNLKQNSFFFLTMSFAALESLMIVEKKWKFLFY